MKQLTVQTNQKSYDVHIGPGSYQLLFTHYGERLAQADKIAIIVDQTVSSLYLPILEDALSFVAEKIECFVIPAGESAKSLETYAQCQSFLLQKGFTRQSMILAFGGGACGDLAGFVAATFMRGIPYIQCPTTILAHDSAVGGKTAINMPEGKNMVGAFHQPEAVLFQTELFQTLPAKEIRSGLAELLKHAFISDAEWTAELLANEGFSTPEEDWLAEQLIRGIGVKAAIVEADELEHSTRKFLNFGHTFGHAVESVVGYGKITHGEAVMIGMVYSLLLSEQLGYTEKKLTNDLIAFLTQQNYCFQPIKGYPFQSFFSYMQKDKKMMGGQLNFVLLKGVGQPFVTDITEAQCMQAFEQLIKRTE